MSLRPEERPASGVEPEHQEHIDRGWLDDEGRCLACGRDYHEHRADAAEQRAEKAEVEIIDWKLAKADSDRLLAEAEEKLYRYEHASGMAEIERLETELAETEQEIEQLRGFHSEASQLVVNLNEQLGAEQAHADRLAEALTEAIDAYVSIRLTEMIGTRKWREVLREHDAMRAQ